jgi:choline dehydrogenase
MPQGQALGGSSNLNFMLYVRGSPHDYNAWAKQSSKIWSYDNVLPYFIKSEDNKNFLYAKTGSVSFDLILFLISITL